MNKILDLTKFIEAEEQANTDLAQTELIEIYRTSHKAFGIRPQVLIGSDRAITTFLNRLYGGEPDWTQPVFINIDTEDKDSVVRVLRSVDMKGNSLNLI